VLERKIVLVTGASSGIGRAIALRCARAGADLAITYRKNQAGAEAAAREIRALGRRAEVMRTDIRRREDIDLLVDQLRSAFDRVDVWVNNAGADILTAEGARLSRLEKLDLVLGVDLRGTVLASWAAVDFMRPRRGGVIINLSWDHVIQGMEGENPGIYSAGKGGVASFSKSLARDVAPDIRVNILAPGFIETAFGEQAAPALGHARRRRQCGGLPGLRRSGISDRPDDYGKWWSGYVGNRESRVASRESNGDAPIRSSLESDPP
jgi:3-oxoacyl-[acyl-carrier protein] reductase